MDMLAVSLILLKVLSFKAVTARIINETAESVIELTSSNNTVSSSINVSVVQESEVNSTDASATVTISPTAMTTLPQRIQMAIQHRLLEIRRHVMASLGWTRTPQIDPALRQHALEIFENGGFQVTPDGKKKHCYYPATASCANPRILPNYINRTMWYNASSNSLNLFFDVMRDHSTRIRTLENATVRLRMRRRAACNCDSEDETGMARIFIGIFQYKRPLRPRFTTPRRKKLDSQRVFQWENERWITFDVKSAISEMYNGTRRNFGFQILVRDMNDEWIDAKRVFYSSDCFGISDYECPINTETTTSPTTVDPTSTNFGPILEITTS